MEGPVLLAVNHSSFLDPPLTAIGINREVNMLAKEELFRIPLFRWWMSSVGVHPVGRKKGDAGAILRAMRLLKEKRALVIYPEGTRTYDGEIQPFEEGLAWLAIKSHVPIVPIYLSGSYRAMPRGKWFPKPCHVHFEIGECIEPDRFPNEETVEKSVQSLTNQIYDKITELRDYVRMKTEGEIKNPSIPA